MVINNFSLQWWRQQQQQLSMYLIQFNSIQFDLIQFQRHHVCLCVCLLCVSVFSFLPGNKIEFRFNRVQYTWLVHATSLYKLPGTNANCRVTRSLYNKMPITEFFVSLLHCNCIITPITVRMPRNRGLSAKNRFSFFCGNFEFGDVQILSDIT